MLREKRHRMAIYVEQMKGLSPLHKLSSGYSYVEDEQGKAIRSIQEVFPEQVLSIQVTDGRIRARVTETEEIETH